MRRAGEGAAVEAELAEALRSLLEASRQSYVAGHVWWPDRDGRWRCIVPNCPICEAEKRAAAVLERWGMDEVSGFGGKYEATVRSMIRAGLEWWDAHPTARPPAG